MLPARLVGNAPRTCFAATNSMTLSLDQRLFDEP